MKKATWLISTVAAALLASGAPLTINAAGPGDEKGNLNTSTDAAFVLTDDADTAEANSVALFSIEPGNLSLKAVPNFNFGNAAVKQLIDGPLALGLANGNVEPGKEGYDGNASNTLEVLDYRGTNAGWTLTAKLGAFAGPTTLIASSLALSGSASGSNYSGSLGTGNIAQAAATVLAPAKGQGSGATTGTVATAKLELPKTATASAGDYRASIVWTLAASPSGTTPMETDNTKSDAAASAID